MFFLFFVLYSEIFVEIMNVRWKKIVESLIMPNSTILFKSIVNFFSSTQCVICLKDRNKLCFDLKIFFINVIWKCVIKNSPIIKINIEHYKQNEFNIIHNFKNGELNIIKVSLLTKMSTAIYVLKRLFLISYHFYNHHILP